MAKINYSESDNPMLEYIVGGYMYSFSVREFPKESYDWLCEVIQTDANRIHNLATLTAKADLQYTIKTALGL